jgi:uncharacterized membrane protein
MAEREPRDEEIEIHIINVVQNILDKINFLIVCIMLIYLTYHMRMKMFDKNYVDRLSLVIIAVSFTAILIRFLF